MVNIQITKEFVDWFREEFSLVTDEPEFFIQEIVGQLYFTGCFITPAPDAALRPEYVEGLVEALRNLLAALDMGGDAILPAYIKARAALASVEQGGAK